MGARLATGPHSRFHKVAHCEPGMAFAPPRGGAGVSVAPGRMPVGIDWPNALVGFALGFLASLPLWLIDRRRSARERQRDAWDAWKGVAKEIELLTYRPETTAGDLYLARVKYPIDSWRAILGPDTFRLLEAVESAY